MKKLILIFLLTASASWAEVTDHGVTSGPWRDDGKTVSTTRSVGMRTTVLNTTTGTVALATSRASGSFTNSGATTDVTYTLPQAAAGIEGLTYTFFQMSTGYDVYVDPNDADQFRGAFSTNANGDRLKSDRVEGSFLSVRCLRDSTGAYKWFTAGTGGWTDAN